MAAVLTVEVTPFSVKPVSVLVDPVLPKTRFPSPLIPGTPEGPCWLQVLQKIYRNCIQYHAYG
jgi:hypothetical protein